MGFTNSQHGMKSFQNEAARDVILTNFAYKHTDQEMQNIAQSIPDEYQLVMMSDHVEDTKIASFRCAAFINNTTKEIVFATAGTRPGLNKRGIDDAYDDLMLLTHNAPEKARAAGIMNDMIIDTLGAELKNYTFHYTGHSLGAAMAEIQSVDMQIKLIQMGQEATKDQITAITFENPGTRPILENIYKDANLSVTHLNKLNLCTFNNRENIINSANMQSGREYRIITEDQKKPPSFGQMIFEAIMQCASMMKLSKIVEVLKLLAPGGIDGDLISDHKLSNFQEIFVQQRGAIEDSRGEVISFYEAYTGIKKLEYDNRIVEEVQKLKSQNGDIGKPIFVMSKFNEVSQKLEKIEFSSIEANHVMRLVANDRNKLNNGVTKTNKSISALKLPDMQQALSGTRGRQK